MRREELPASLKIDGHSLSWLNSIEEKVETFWETPLLQHYTNHGIDHSQRIIKALGKLLEGFPGLLNRYERFILLASIYLHDIGMQSPRHARLPEKIEYTIKEKEKVREVHNESSALMIEESITSESELSLGLNNCKEYAPYIARVSKFHRKLDLKKLGNTSIGGEEVRLQLLAALLRLGDALDADYQRVNMDYLSLWEIPVESKFHWWCHHYVQSVLIQRGHIRIYFRFPDEYKGEKVTDVIEKKVKESISKTHMVVYDILDEHGMRLYREVEIGEKTYLPKGSLQVIPDDLYGYIEDNVLNIVGYSEAESIRTGVDWYVDGVPFSDDADVRECLRKVLELVRKDKFREAFEEVDRCRLLTMSPKDRMIFSVLAGNCYYLLGNLKKSKDYYRDALKISERHVLQNVYKKEVTQTRATAFENIGLVYWIRGHLDTALKYLANGLRLHREAGHKRGEAEDLCGIGVVYLTKGDLNKSFQYLSKALEIDRQIGYKRGEAYRIGNIGVVYHYRGDLDNAQECFKEALDIGRELGHKRVQALALGNMGEISMNKGDLDEALKYHEDALEIDIQIGCRGGEAIDLGNIGLVYCAKSDLDEALKYFKKALKIYREIGNRCGEATQLGNIGLIFRRKGKLGKALRYHKKALEIDEKFGYRIEEADQLGNIGLVYADRGNPNKALEYLKNALEIDREIGYRLGEAKLLHDIGMALNLSGKETEALKYLNKSLDIFEEIGMEKEADKARKHISEICLQRKNRKE